MSTTFNTLPDIIIEEILSILELKDQIKLRFCNRRISWLLKYIVFEEVSAPKGYRMRNNRSDYYYLKNMATQIGKYVKRLDLFIGKPFFEVVDEFPNLEYIEVYDDPEVDIFDQLHSLELKLKSFSLDLSEPFPTQPQFNFNHIIKNLIDFDLTLWNKKSKSLGVLEMVQIPNLKVLRLSADYFPEDTLVNINRNFSDLKILSLNNQGDQLELTLIPTTFLKLKNLTLYLSGIQNYAQFPFQSFPQLKVLDFSDSTGSENSAINIIKEKLFKQLLSLSIIMYKLSINDVSNLPKLKYAYLDLSVHFDTESMQHLLSLPKLSQLTLRYDLFDDLFRNVTCKSPLYSLTIFDSPLLSHNFFKFLQFNTPLLRKLVLEPVYGERAFEADTFSEINGQTNLNLLYLGVHRSGKKFAKWVEEQSPNVYITFLDSDDQLR